ncbi:UNVERIFIED_CONTAM: hypothetical protein FKN15_058968 [Acipenser sinensis]
MTNVLAEADHGVTGSAHRYHPRADSGVAKTNTLCLPKRVPSADRFFSHCRLTVQTPRSYSVGGQRNSAQLTGKPADAWPDYWGRWCTMPHSYSVGYPNKVTGLTVETDVTVIDLATGDGSRNIYNTNINITEGLDS